MTQRRHAHTPHVPDSGNTGRRRLGRRCGLQQTGYKTGQLISWLTGYAYTRPNVRLVARFDDLTDISGGTNDDYFISASSATDGLMTLTKGDAPYEDKDNFYYADSQDTKTAELP